MDLLKVRGPSPYLVHCLALYLAHSLALYLANSPACYLAHHLSQHLAHYLAPSLAYCACVSPHMLELYFTHNMTESQLTM